MCLFVSVFLSDRECTSSSSSSFKVSSKLAKYGSAPYPFFLLMLTTCPCLRNPSQSKKKPPPFLTHPCSSSSSSSSLLCIAQERTRRIPASVTIRSCSSLQQKLFLKSPTPHPPSPSLARSSLYPFLHYNLGLKTLAPTTPSSVTRSTTAKSSAISFLFFFFFLLLLCSCSSSCSSYSSAFLLPSSLLSSLSLSPWPHREACKSAGAASAETKRLRHGMQHVRKPVTRGGRETTEKRVR